MVRVVAMALLLLLTLVAAVVFCGEFSASVSASPSLKPPSPSRVLWFDQTLDHFEFSSNATFQQRVFTYDEHWKTADGPLLVYFGNEGALEDFWNNTGFMFELAPQVDARIVFVEHRFYGSTLPFGAASYDDENLVFLTIEQALADMAQILGRKTSFLNASSESKVVLFGGSYGGMLAAWFMQKYPQLANGALAASAPVDIYPGEGKAKAFFDAGMYVYGKFGSSACESWIREALLRVQRLGSSVKGRKTLDDQFHSCEGVRSELDAEKLLFYVNGGLSTMAMVDYPFAANFVTPMPANPVAYACNATRFLSASSSDSALIAGLNTAVNVFVNFSSQLQCHNISKELLASSPLTSRHYFSSPPAGLGDITRPWNYQACTELILEPLTSDGDGFFVPLPSQVPSVVAACKRLFPGIQARPKWMLETFGDGIQIVKTTRNIIFSDGEKDPWRVGGVPNNASLIGDGSVRHILIENGAHHQDLRYSDSRNPIEVEQAKKLETDIIKRWVSS